MLFKTRGIVINYVRYRDTSILVKIYTEKFGLQTYIENGVRSSKSKNKIALFQPLTLLDLVVYHDDKKEIHRLKEIRCSHAFLSLPYQVEKSSIGIFLNEILSKVLIEEAENPPLFNFLSESFIALDQTPSHYENFHLQFLLKLTFFLGFSPENADEIERQFKEYSLPVHFDKWHQVAINQLIRESYFGVVSLNRTQRNQLIDAILLYYRLHIEGLSDVKSLHILREILE